jgi:hypothetical protein
VLDKLGKYEELEFTQNYLNRWVDVAHGKPDPGSPVVSESEWRALAVPEPAASGVPAVAAVESWFSEGASVALGWPLSAERVLVRIETYPDVNEALRSAFASGAGLVLAGKSIAADAPGCVPVSSTTRQAVTELRRFIDDNALAHDNNAELTAQVLALRTVPGVDGPRVTSTNRTDAIKCAAWVVNRGRLLAERPAVF